jgi:type I restriction enzyme R subunit
VDKKKLRNLIVTNVTETRINEFGRFDDLKASVDQAKAKEYFEKLEQLNLSPFQINMRVHALLKKFILYKGFDIEEPKE